MSPDVSKASCDKCQRASSTVFLRGGAPNKLALFFDPSMPLREPHSVWARLADAVEAARAESNSIRETNAELEDRIASLTGALADASEACNAVKLQLSLAEAASESLQSALNKSREDSARLTRRVARRDVAFKDALDQLGASQRDRKKAEEGVQECREKLRDQEAAFERAICALQDKDSELQAERNEVRSLREALQAARADGERRATANEHLRHKLAERDERLAAISARCTREGPPLADASNFIQQGRSASAEPAIVACSASPARAIPVVTASSGSGGCDGASAAGALQAVEFARAVLDATRADASGTALEELTRRLFQVMGYHVPPRNSGPGDRGIDVRAYRADDTLEVIQCKSKGRGKANVSFGEMSEFIGAMALAGCQTGHFVTNAAFTSQALQAARHLPERTVVTLGADELAALLHRHHAQLATDHHVASLIESTRERRVADAAAVAVLQRAARRRSSIGSGVNPATPSQEQRAPTTPAAPTTLVGTPSSAVARAVDSRVAMEAASPAAAAAGAALAGAQASVRGGAIKTRLAFSGEEEALLCRLWHEKGFAMAKQRGERYRWKEILEEGRGVFHIHRTAGDLKDKARNIGLLLHARTPGADTTLDTMLPRTAPGAETTLDTTLPRMGDNVRAVAVPMHPRAATSASPQRQLSSSPWDLRPAPDTHGTATSPSTPPPPAPAPDPHGTATSPFTPPPPTPAAGWVTSPDSSARGAHSSRPSRNAPAGVTVIDLRLDPESSSDEDVALVEHRQCSLGDSHSASSDDDLI